MSARILVVAPHPDDETLGCGGTLLKHAEQGAEIHWLIITHMSERAGYSVSQINLREQEIKAVAEAYQFTSVINLTLPPAGLDQISDAQLVEKVNGVVQKLMPDTVYLPYRYDVHSDHKRCFDATIAATKSFRAPFVKSLRVYETLSETDYNLDVHHPFTPNIWVDISCYLDKKLKIMEIYKSELGHFPFPRSTEAIIAQAKLRGAQCGAKAGEAFMLLKEIY